MNEQRSGAEDERARRVEVGEEAGVPRWVKVFAVVGLLVVVLVVVMLLAGHGPGQHMSHGSGTPMLIDAVDASRW